MHYSALNAVSAASPASASPSSSSLSSLSPVGHSHYHHLSSNEQQHSQASHHNSHSHDQLMASMSEGSSSISSSPYNTSGASSVTSTVIKTENMCDDLATYTTLQSSAPNTQQHYGNNDHHMTSSGQTAGPGNGAANTSSAGPKAGSKRSAPSSTTTATKSTYNGNSSSGGGNKSSGANSNGATPTGRTNPGGGKKTKGRVKIKMEFIDNKLRRYTTFSKRKTGIMKKAYELSTLTGTQVMLLVASETGHVYTFATRKLQPMITSDAGKALIQTCLNSPDPSGLMNGSAGSGSAASNTTGPDVVTTNGHVSTLVGGNNSGPVANSHSQLGQQQADGQHHNSDLSRMLSAGPGSLSGCSTPNTVEQRMSATGFEETELSYSVNGDDCSPLNEKGIFSGCLTIGTSSLVNSGPGTTSNSTASTPTVNGSLLRGKAAHQSAFFINETPGLGGQGSEEDDEEEEEDDEEEEPEEEDDDPELDMAYLAGLHGLDADLTRLIGSQTPSSQLDAMLTSALWAQPPPLPMGQPKQQQSQNQQQPQSQPNSLAASNQTTNSSGFVSDRTKLNLNLKLQQKQQMQRSQQAQQQSMRAAMGQGTLPRTAGQFTLQPQQQNKAKGSSTGQKSTKGSGFNKKNSSSTLRSTAAKSATAVTSTSLHQSSTTSSLATSQQQQQLSSAANSFVNFDPASFLDSCFNTCSSTGSPSPDSNSLLDAHHTLDQMLLANSGELLLLNQGMQNTNPNQTMSTEQQFNFMMMIGGGGNNNNTVTSAPSLMNSQTTNFSNTATSKQATALKSSNLSRNTSARTSSSSSQLSNSFGSSIRTTVPQQQQVNFGQQLNNNSPSNFSSNLSGNCFLSSQKQQLPTAVTSATSTTNKQAVQSKAANLNAIINNLASASSNNSAAASSTSVSGVGASGHNTSGSLNNSIDNSQNRGGLLGDQTAGAGGSGGGGLNQFGAMAAAAAQQLLSGNIILCTTPTSTLTLPNLDQSANNSNLNLPTSNTTTQLFSLSGGHSGTADSNNSSGPTTLLLPANLQASGLSIQPNSGNGPNGAQSSQQQLIYNAFSGLGRILYQAAPGQGQGMNQNRCDTNQGGSDGSQQQTFSTLITADGQQLILNVANASTNSIAQLVNTQANQAADNSRLRVKNQNLPESANTSPSISLLPGGQHSLVQHSTDHHLGQHSISLDSLLGPSLGPTPAPLITTFPSGQTLVTPVSTSTVVNGNLFGQPPKASPGSNLKKQRTK